MVLGRRFYVRIPEDAKLPDVFIGLGYEAKGITMDQERNEFGMIDQDAPEEAPVVAPEQEDEEIAEIKAAAKREMATIEKDLARADERLEMEYTTLGRRAFEFAQTDEVLASKLGVALAAVTAQVENRGKLARSLEAIEKKTADRIADVLRAREAEEADRRFEEELARKEAAAQEAMERARALEREAAEARRAREESRREADAAVLAASQTMLLSFTDDAPDLSAIIGGAQDESEPETPVVPEPEVEQEEWFAPMEAVASEPDADAELAPEPDETAVYESDALPEPEPEIPTAWDSAAEPEVQPAPEPETLLAPEPEPEIPTAWDFAAEPEAQPAPEPEPAFDAEVASDAEPPSLLVSEGEIEPEPESLLAPEPAYDDAPDDVATALSALLEQDAHDVMEPESLLAPEPDSLLASDEDAEAAFAAPVADEAAVAEEPDTAAPAPVDPNATLYLDDYNEQPSWRLDAEGEQPAVDPKATLLLDDAMPEHSEPESSSEPAPEPATAAEIICPTCGAPCGQGDFFCLMCGTKLDAAQAPAAPAAETPSDSDYVASESVEPAYPVSEPSSEPEHAPRHAAPAAPTCIACGHELQPGDKFCMVCGAKQEPAPVAAPVAPAVAPAPPVAAPAAPAVSAAPSNFCMSCGFELQPGDKFCMQCGKPAQQVPTEAAPVVPEARICPNCGAEYTEADKFCMMCGYRL